MNRYRHLLAFDLSSYGAALAIVNQFVDDKAIRLFEISPVGTSAQLILLSEEIQALEFIRNEAQSLFRAQILASEVVADVHSDLLPTYLSQKSSSLKRAMAVFEGESVALGLQLAQAILKSGLSLVDFRVVRTSPKNVIITATADTTESLLNLKAVSFRRTCLENLQNPLRELFEVVQTTDSAN